jgi:hypothetical protein
VGVAATLLAGPLGRGRCPIRPAASSTSSRALSLALMTSDYEKLTEVMKASGLGPERGEPGLATSSLRGAERRSR